jgi:hypothetical protein
MTVQCVLELASGHRSDAAIQSCGGKIGAKVRLVFRPALRRRADRLCEQTGKAQDSIIERNRAYFPFVVRQAWGDASEAKQPVKVRASDLGRMDSNELARGGGKLHLRVTQQERTRVRHKKLDERGAREHEHESRDHRVCEAKTRVFAGWPPPRGIAIRLQKERAI